MSHRNTSLLTFAFLCSLLASASIASAAQVDLRVHTDREDALYSQGETIRFNITLHDGDTPMQGETVTYHVSKDGIGELAAGELTTTAEPFTVEASLDEPGFVRCRVQWVDADGKTITKLAGAAVDPQQIAPSLPVPDDFDAYWAQQRKLVEAEPLQPTITEVPSKKTEIAMYDVQANCPGGLPMSGYFGKPKNAKPASLPAILSLHGAGVRSSNFDSVARHASYGAIALDINAHGLPNGKPKAFYDNLRRNELRGYSVFGREDMENIYFRGMFLRIIRAIEFLTTQPEWDGKTLIVIGSSQGGGQALVAGGLDPRVSLVIANVAAISDHTGFVVGRATGWPRLVARDSEGNYSENGTQVARYFDAMNFASRIRGQVIMTVGFIDTVCPPTSVYATFNNVTAPKRMYQYPRMGHAFPNVIQNMIAKAIHDHIAGRPVIE